MKDFAYDSPFCQRLADAMKAAEAEGVTLSDKSIRQKLGQDDAEALAALVMRDSEAVSIPWEEFVRPLKLGALQKQYRMHTEKASALSQENPEASRAEMLACIQLTREIRELQKKTSG